MKIICRYHNLFSQLIKFQGNRRFFIVWFLLLILAPEAHAAYTPFNTSITGNIGIGTSSPQTKLSIVGGNVGIGTWATAGGILILNGGGNVGIGSAWPGQMLDVQGTVRDIGEIMNGNVGIGTSALQAAFSVTNGNVGIGTWTAAGGNLIVNGGSNVGIGSAWPGQMLDVQGTIRAIGENVNGNVGIGTSANQTALSILGGNVGIGTWTAAGGNLIVNGGGNVGIGSAWPGAQMDVNGSLRATDISFPSEISNGTCNNNTVTINWNSGNKQTVIIGPPTCNIAFTAPSTGVSNLTLRVVQDGSGSRVVNSWTSTPKWAGGAAPTLSTGIGAVDIITCYYNGTNYYCAASLSFS